MHLDRLQGSWGLTMQHNAVSEPILGHQSYEYTLDGAFLKLTWHYERPDFPDAIAILDDTHFHYFDVRGIIRVFDFRLDDAGWQAEFVTAEFSQRTVGRFVGDGEIDVVGELAAEDGTWHHDFDMKLLRVSLI